MNYWLLLAWEDTFHLSKRLIDPENLTTWGVPRKEHREQMQAGDVGFLWSRAEDRAKGWYLRGRAVILTPDAFFARSSWKTQSIPQPGQVCVEIPEAPWERQHWNPAKGFDPNATGIRLLAEITDRTWAYPTERIDELVSGWNSRSVFAKKAQIDRTVALDPRQGKSLDEFIANMKETKRDNR